MKILITHRVFLIAFCITLFAVVFVFNTESGSENRLNYQVQFVSEKTANRKIDEFKNNHEIVNKNQVDRKAEISKEINTKTDRDDPEIQTKDLHSYISEFSSELLMAADLQEKYDADEMDYVLAAEAEKNLAYVFYQGMDWQEFSPQEISCKANMCRIKLKMPSEQESNKLMTLISDQMQLKNINYSFALPVNLPVEGIGYIYFVKSSLTGVLPGNN